VRGGNGRKIAVGSLKSSERGRSIRRFESARRATHLAAHWKAEAVPMIFLPFEIIAGPLRFLKAGASPAPATVDGVTPRWHDPFMAA